MLYARYVDTGDGEGQQNVTRKADDATAPSMTDGDRTGRALVDRRVPNRIGSATTPCRRGSQRGREFRYRRRCYSAGTRPGAPTSKRPRTTSPSRLRLRLAPPADRLPARRLGTTMASAARGPAAPAVVLAAAALFSLATLSGGNSPASSRGAAARGGRSLSSSSPLGERTAPVPCWEPRTIAPGVGCGLCRAWRLRCVMS